MSHDFEALRYKLIEQQIRPWNVPNLEVLEALRQIPRETFVPEDQAILAFADTKLPLPHAKNASQTMLEPKMEARLLQALENFAKSVTSVDIDPEMVTLAKSNLTKAYISNVQVEVGDAYTGWGEQSYDVICVSGGMPSLYEGLKQQLAVGGRLVAFIGEAPVMNAVLVKRHDATYFSETILFETVIAHIQSPKVKHGSFEF